MQEVWKDIYFVENGIEWDYRGLYQVSNLGRVKRLNRIVMRNNGKLYNVEEKLLNPNKIKNNYLRVCLKKNGKQKHFLVHRLVAHMFVNGYFNGAEVDHIDTNPLNNHVYNLRWCNRIDNINNQLTKKKLSESKKGNQNGKGNKNKAQGNLIARYDKQGNLLDIKYNYEYVKMGFNASKITDCCKNRHKSHKGYIFKYHIKKEEE